MWLLQSPVAQMSTAFLCVCVCVLKITSCLFNSPPLFSLYLSTQQEVIFGVLWDLSLVTTFGQYLGAEKVVEAACAASVSFAGWGGNLVGTWLSLVAVQTECICFNVVLIGISCYNVLFINLQET